MKERKKTRRKPYSKPDLLRVRLTPEETLSANCKTTGSTANPAQVSDCLSDGCYDIGS